jgi:hypothetical protein
MNCQRDRSIFKLDFDFCKKFCTYCDREKAYIFLNLNNTPSLIKAQKIT